MAETKIPTLRLDEFIEVDFLENEWDIEVFAVPVETSATKFSCPHCQSSETISHGSEERFFRDINMYEKRVGVAVEGKRYKCKSCGKTFVREFECIDTRGRITKRLKTAIQKKALHHTFASVAEEYGLGSTTVRTAFEDYSEILNLRPQVKAPRVLGIDECHLQKVMRPVYVDVENGLILEMGRSTKQVDVARDLSAFEGLENVEVVTTDMCNGYRGAIQALFPNAIHVVDKFHVVKMFIDAVEEARKGILDALKARFAKIGDASERARQEQILADLNVDSYMFKMNPENMADWRLARMLEICDTYNEFRELAALRKMFFRFYQQTNPQDAVLAFSDFCKAIPLKPPYYNAMRKLVTTTFKNWNREIFNYFRVDGRKTNAVTERLNGAIKSMQNMGRGYSFQVLRAKMLFGASTAKAPLYQRISKAGTPQTGVFKTANQQIAMMTTFYTDDSEPFLLPPEEGGGVVEVCTYYDAKAMPTEKPMTEFELLLDKEMHLHDTTPSSASKSDEKAYVRNPDLQLVENGGASIEKIIEFFQRHGECI